MEQFKKSNMYVRTCIFAGSYFCDATVAGRNMMFHLGVELPNAANTEADGGKSESNRRF